MNDKRILQIGGVLFSIGIILGLAVAWYVKTKTDAHLVENWELARQAGTIVSSLAPFAIGAGGLGALLLGYGAYRAKAKVRNY